VSRSLSDFLPTAPLSEPDEILDRFDRQHYGELEEPIAPERKAPARVDMASRLRGMWA